MVCLKSHKPRFLERMVRAFVCVCAYVYVCVCACICVSAHMPASSGEGSGVFCFEGRTGANDATQHLIKVFGKSSSNKTTVLSIRSTKVKDIFGEERTKPEAIYLLFLD